MVGQRFFSNGSGGFFAGACLGAIPSVWWTLSVPQGCETTELSHACLDVMTSTALLGMFVGTLNRYCRSSQDFGLEGQFEPDGVDTALLICVVAFMLKSWYQLQPDEEMFDPSNCPAKI